MKLYYCKFVLGFSEERPTLVRRVPGRGLHYLQCCVIVQGFGRFSPQAAARATPKRQIHWTPAEALHDKKDQRSRRWQGKKCYCVILEGWV